MNLIQTRSTASAFVVGAFFGMPVVAVIAWLSLRHETPVAYETRQAAPVSTVQSFCDDTPWLRSGTTLIFRVWSWGTPTAAQVRASTPSNSALRLSYEQWVGEGKLPEGIFERLQLWGIHLADNRVSVYEANAAVDSVIAAC